MKAFWYHLTIEFLAGLRNWTLLLMNYLLPLGCHVMMGLIMANISPLFRETMIPAMVIFAVLSGMILGLPQPLVEAREAGIYRNYKINGVPALSIVAIPALSALIHVAITSTIITITGHLFFNAPLPGNWLAFAGLFLLFAGTCAGIGVLIGVVASSPRTTVLFSQLIYLPSMMISGMMVPAAILPEVMVRVGRLLPATYAMDAFNAGVMGLERAYDPVWAVLVLGTTGILALTITLWLFRWDNKDAVRRPLVLAVVVMIPMIVGAILLPLGERTEFLAVIWGAW